jgi:hypothetical protein
VDVSVAYRDEMSGREDLEILIEARPMLFDAMDNLAPF